MAEPRRIKRLEQLILRTIGPMISHGLADPRLGLVTVTRVKLSRDLSVARINWSIVGSDADRSRAEHALDHARGHLQTAVAQAMRTRTTPHLEFHYDPSMENAARIHEILHEIEEERREREGPEEEDAPEE
ncbi:MAG: 30S ribosome-binding factor RbfA [Planctomycetota bacterium]|jgi:ribosome-binding factor A